MVEITQVKTPVFFIDVETLFYKGRGYITLAMNNN